jgi:hypothetical protein
MTVLMEIIQVTIRMEVVEMFLAHQFRVLEEEGEEVSLYVLIIVLREISHLVIMTVNVEK